MADRRVRNSNLPLLGRFQNYHKHPVRTYALSYFLKFLPCARARKLSRQKTEIAQQLSIISKESLSGNVVDAQTIGFIIGRDI